MATSARSPLYVPTLIFFVVKSYLTGIPNLKVCDFSYTYRTRDTSRYSRSLDAFQLTFPRTQ